MLATRNTSLPSAVDRADVGRRWIAETLAVRATSFSCCCPRLRSTVGSGALASDADAVLLRARVCSCGAPRMLRTSRVLQLKVPVITSCSCPTSACKLQSPAARSCICWANISILNSCPCCCCSYLWQEDGKTPDLLPASLAKPWCLLASCLQVPPILNYSTYILHNWRRSAPGKVPADCIALMLKLKLPSARLQCILRWHSDCMRMCCKTVFVEAEEGSHIPHVHSAPS